MIFNNIQIFYILIDAVYIIYIDEIVIFVLRLQDVSGH